jgi:hypothetical protein
MFPALWFESGGHALTIISISGALWFLMEWRLFNFFTCKRGRNFAIKALAWQWFYYIYSGLTFIIVGIHENCTAQQLPKTTS